MSGRAWAGSFRFRRRPAAPNFKRRVGFATRRPALTLKRSKSVATQRRQPWLKGRSLGFVFSFLLAFAFALAIGLGTAHYAIETGTPLTVEQAGPWSSWPTEGNPIADPYTRAHLARSGRLPLTSSAARYFIAKTDNAGRTLHANCDYTIEGAALDAQWWTLTLYDADGNLIGNRDNRYGYNSTEILRRSDGGYLMHLSRNARPENWLPVGANDRRSLMLLLRAYGVRSSDITGIGQVPPEALPRIERGPCA